MDSRRVFFFCLLMFILFTTPDSHSSSHLPERERQKQLAEEQRSLALLNATQYGDFNATADRWLPLAGLTSTDGFAWDMLPVVQDRARDQLLSNIQASDISTAPSPGELYNNTTRYTLPVYNNVTGKLRGDWAKWKSVEPHVPRPQLNITSLLAGKDYSTPVFGRNITANHGNLFLVLREEEGEVIVVDETPCRQIKADLVIHNDESFGENWVIPLFGIHFPKTGTITLSTTSEKFAGLSALPHFALSRDSFELSRALLMESLSDSMLRRRGGPAPFFPWSSLPRDSRSVIFPSPRCEYIMYLQQRPVLLQGAVAKVELLETIEGELRFPRGTPIPDPPPMVMSAVIFSPDCGFVLETKDSPNTFSVKASYISGPKQEEYRRYAGRFVTIVAVVLVSQIALLKRQIKGTSTPSTRSRVSFYTIASMSMGDAMFAAFVLLELYAEASFLLLTAASFLAFFSVSFLSMKFQIELWAAQPPDPNENPYQGRSRTSTGLQSDLPLPATASRTVNDDTPQSIRPNPAEEGPLVGPPPPAQQDGNASRSDASSMYSRFYLVLFFLMFFSSWTLFWPSRLRAGYVNTLSFVYLSFWSPQIFRNAMRNCRKALHWDFVFGQSFLRLFPFLYFYLVPGNVLFLEVPSMTVLVLVAWVWIQLCILVSQDMLGPRFFVPDRWFPPAYDYHPILYDTPDSSGEGPEPAGGLSLTSLRAEQRDTPPNARDDSKRPSEPWKKLFDCAICMQDIEVPVLVFPNNGRRRPNLKEGTTNLLSRRTYMVTPCHHIFHGACLETWLHLRLQCPICREAIPPV